MTVLFNKQTTLPMDASLYGVIEQITELSLAQEGFPLAVEISVSIVDDLQIQQINRRFRRIDKPTDVLSFPQLSFVEGEIMEKNENNEIVLGDIILSLERAATQALDYGHSLKREIAFLTAHSMLHLLGYDHQYEAQEADMLARTEKILAAAGIER